MKLNTEIISELFQCFILHLKLKQIISAAEIIWKLFQRHWACWKILM